MANMTEYASLVTPLCLEPYAADIARARAAAQREGAPFDLAASQAASPWFPNLQVDPASAYATSAVLATALDTFTLAYRRHPSFVPPTAPQPPKPATTTTTTTTSAAAAAALSWSGAPVLALPRGASVASVVNHLRPAPAFNVVSLHTALPFSHPHATPSALHNLLSGGKPCHEADVSALAPLSWPCDLPAGGRGGGGTAAARAPGQFGERRRKTEMSTNRAALYEAAARAKAGPGAPLTRHCVPMAHLLTLRGVKAHGRHVGLALDQFMARTPCRTARHVTTGLPLPIPMSFPSIFRPVFDAHGGRSVPAASSSSSSSATKANAITRRWPGDPRGWGASCANVPRGKSASAVCAPVEVPESVPVMAWAANTSGYAPVLHAAQGWWKAQPVALRRRLMEAGLDEEALGDVRDRLGGLCDNYEPDSQM